MGCNRVDVGRNVDYKTLETALIKAAEEVGWTAKVRDKFKTTYKLGCVEGIQNYCYTDILLSRMFFQTMEVTLYGKEPANSFSVSTGPGSGFASDLSVRRYLNAVSRNLQAVNPKP